MSDKAEKYLVLGKVLERFLLDDDKYSSVIEWPRSKLLTLDGELTVTDEEYALLREIWERGRG